MGLHVGSRWWFQWFVLLFIFFFIYPISQLLSCIIHPTLSLSFSKPNLLRSSTLENPRVATLRFDCSKLMLNRWYIGESLNFSWDAEFKSSAPFSKHLVSYENIREGWWTLIQNIGPFLSLPQGKLHYQRSVTGNSPVLYAAGPQFRLLLQVCWVNNILEVLPWSWKNKTHSTTNQ